MSKLIEGSGPAERLKQELKGVTCELEQKTGIKPGLAILRVGTDPASELYVQKKGGCAQEIGFHFEEHAFPEDVSTQVLSATIAKLNQSASIHGIVLQLPLPMDLERTCFLSLIDPSKDVDGLTPLNAGKLFQGIEGFVPATPLGCEMLLRSLYPSFEGCVVGIVGCSILVGRPLAMLMLNHKSTIWMAHDKTKDLPDLCRTADILVVAIGNPEFVQGDWIKKGATVLDVGINRLPSGKIVGDVDFTSAVKKAGAITPVPGGVGPMTVAALLYNTLKATFHFAKRPFPLNVFSNRWLLEGVQCSVE